MSDVLMRMGTTPRHNNLVSSLFIEIGTLFKTKKLYAFQESCFLVHEGKKYSGDEKLVDSLYGTDKEFVDELGVIQPDFMLFQDNKYSQVGIKIVGIPDLVVEVWSKSNDKLEREMKHRIYSSSSLCEHWYLKQYSNAVECWMGNTKLSTQNLLNPLITTRNITFDLSHMAI